ncbi:baseplate multidomain protein megatron [Roseinatronobacter sp.]
MATLVLGAVGTAIGGSIGGSILGVSAAAIGGFIGSSIGSIVDARIMAPSIPGQEQRFEGARLDNLRLTSSVEGLVLPRVYGRMRLGGNIIWATDFREEIRTRTETQSTGGGKGGGGGGTTVTTTSTTYHYFASFAVALCEGPITGIGRIWADGKVLDTRGLAWRWYPGDETQPRDPFISARMGAQNTPAYRGTAYVFFEDLPLERFGNRLPQLSFEVFRPVTDDQEIENRLTSVQILPGAGEFVYGTTPVRASVGAVTRPENTYVAASRTDFAFALDQLQAQAPAIQGISLSAAWFGTDLRAGHCILRPGVEDADKHTDPYLWEVNGVPRAQAHVISHTGGVPVYGGTPADRSLIEAIREAKARGLRVSFTPAILMDLPASNTLPDPYSDSATGQPAFPAAARITCSPAAGFDASPDKSAQAAAQVAQFFGAASLSDFTVADDEVHWTGGSDWGLRRMVLHYAHLCAAAGGVDAFLISTDLRGLTQIRSDASTYPAVAALQALAAECRTILGAGTALSYAADWREYSGHTPQDGSGDRYFHLDLLWAHPAIDFIGINNLMPLSDWRDGEEHADALAGVQSVYDPEYLEGNITGGEHYDWIYATQADREAQIRTPIADPAYGKPWVFRPKDLRNWWQNPHINRAGGVEVSSPTAWIPRSKPIRFTALGCPAIDRGTNQPDAQLDPKSSEAALPWYSRGWRDDSLQRAYFNGQLGHWREAANNPTSPLYGGAMVHVGEITALGWDARPYPQYPELTEVWPDWERWRLGPWLTGRLGSGSLAGVVRDLCTRGSADPALIDVSGLRGNVEGYIIPALESARRSIEVLQRHYGFDVIESEGRLRFVMRGRGPVAIFTPDDLVAQEGSSDTFELKRAQETELPLALKWQVVRSDEEYDSNIVEAARTTVASSRVNVETFTMAVPPEDAETQVRRALQEVWVGRDSASFTLPPSNLALDPGDPVLLAHDGRHIELRIVSIADNTGRVIEAVAQDREVYGLPAGVPRRAALGAPVVFGASIIRFLDLPQLREDVPDHQPLLAVFADPWPGSVAVFRSATQDGFRELGTASAPARVGRVLEPFGAGPVSRFDLQNALVVELQSGSIESVPDIDLFEGANPIAVETGPGQWEILQAGTAELIAPQRYRLTRLLRGQRGTESAIVPQVPANATVVLLDGALTPLPVARSELGLPFNYRIGPAELPPSEDAYVPAEFTASGAGLRPFSPVHVEQPYLHGRSIGTYSIRWIRRDRDLAADSWAAAEIPNSESSEAYEVEIMDGEDVLRTLTSSTTSVAYTQAQQVADRGAALGPGDTLRIRIYQLSAAFGRGAATDTILHF